MTITIAPNRLSALASAPPTAPVRQRKPTPATLTSTATFAHAAALPEEGMTPISAFGPQSGSEVNLFSVSAASAQTARGRRREQAARSKPVEESSWSALAAPGGAGGSLPAWQPGSPPRWRIPIWSSGAVPRRPPTPGTRSVMIKPRRYAPAGTCRTGPRCPCRAIPCCRWRRPPPYRPPAPLPRPTAR